jgi:CRISPR-associated protein Cas7/Cst2/DevR subtype I-B
MHLTILIVSNPVLAANNRGEGTGNLQTLQHITTPTGVRTVLSGAALKRAIRDSMIARGAKMWRRNDNNNPLTNPAGYVYGENNSPTLAKATPGTPDGYDDEQFGFMKAEKDKGDQAVKKKGACELSVAISTTNYDGDVGFHLGLKAAEPQLNPYGAERHYTRYQYTITWDLSLVRPQAFQAAAEALRSLAVGGSHSSNATEITPDQVAWAFHAAPGRAGLQVGMGDLFPPDQPVDLSSIVARARAIGAANAVKQGTSGEALSAIIAEALPYCKVTA